MRGAAPPLPLPPRHLPPDMETHRFQDEDTPAFLSLAADEGWISDQGELEFLRRTFPRGCLVKKVNGVPAAFITSLPHDRSGWIGNLLVHPELRRQGIGAELFEEALVALKESGVETVWLTASPSGKPLYEKRGFREIDQIDRWIGENYVVTVPPERYVLPENLKQLDSAGWGDRRESLLTALAAEGETILGENAYFISRKLERVRQIGPLTGSAQAVTDLFQRHVTPKADGERICLDLPQKNEVVGRFLEQQGLKKSGSTILMYRGAPPAYRPELIGACASMGSMG
jgi:ribosomal protein S18 acetylase RimI-like enzyme